jgi:glycosyltransferase involved in cell wall biosynthesis
LRLRASVIVPVYNGSCVIVEQLDALNRQTCLSELEIIVVDDDSHDGTGDVVDAWVRDNQASGFNLIRRASRGGPNAARNTGLSLARCELVLFCDGDDVVDDSWATAMIEASQPGAILSGPYLRLGGDPTDPRDWILQTRKFLDWEFAFGGNLGVERSLAMSIGGFDESITLGGTEVEFCIRAQLMANARIARVDRAIVNHRAPAGTTHSISRAFRRERGHAYIARRYGEVSTFAAWLPHYLTGVKVRVNRCLFLLLTGARDPYPRDLSSSFGRLLGYAVWRLHARIHVPRARLMTRNGTPAPTLRG